MNQHHEPNTYNMTQKSALKLQNNLIKQVNNEGMGSGNEAALKGDNYGERLHEFLTKICIFGRLNGKHHAIANLVAPLPKTLLKVFVETHKQLS